MRGRTPPEGSSASRLPFLEGLRGLAALYVVLGHIATLADPARLLGITDHAPLWFQNLMRPLGYGHLAVAAFIVLSGFCLQLSLFSRADGRIGRLGVFFRRRALRILPAYYACLGFSIIVCIGVTSHDPALDRFLPVTWDNVLAHLFLIHNFSEGWMYKINGVLWSIALEAQLYILFPLLVASFSRWGRWKTLIAGAILAAAAVEWIPRAPKLYFWYLPLFLAGMVAAHVGFRPSLRGGPRPAFAWTALVSGLGVAAWAIATGDYLPLSDAGFGVAIAALCYLLLIRAFGAPSRVLSWKPLVALGGFSYSLYLMHHPILQIVYVFRPSTIADEVSRFWYLMGVGVPLSLVGTWLFSLAFERPYMAKRREMKVTEKAGLMPASLPLKPCAVRSGDSIGRRELAGGRIAGSEAGAYIQPAASAEA